LPPTPRLVLGSTEDGPVSTTRCLTTDADRLLHCPGRPGVRESRGSWISWAAGRLALLAVGGSRPNLPETAFFPQARRGTASQPGGSARCLATDAAWARCAESPGRRVDWAAGRLGILAACVGPAEPGADRIGPGPSRNCRTHRKPPRPSDRSRNTRLALREPWFSVRLGAQLGLSIRPLPVCAVARHAFEVRCLLPGL
jgi:hypothetical protein